jgi:hypothetical protein
MNIPTKQDYTLSREWAVRPDDERFLSLTDLRASVAARADCSRSTVVDPRGLIPDMDGNNVILRSPEVEHIDFTNWSFGQTASVAKAPASYLRRLPPQLTTALLTHGLRIDADNKKHLMYYERGHGDTGRLRAITSEKYGRILDLDVVDAVLRLNEAQNGRWVIPAASYATANPKRATTLYASDRDVFVFLCDPATPITIPGQKEPSFRGFIVSNSEVGSAAFKLTLFLYQRVCDNRIIWGQSHVKGLSIRHNVGAPSRFLHEAGPALEDYANRTVEQEIKLIERAQSIDLKKAAPGEGTYEDILKWVRERTGVTTELVKTAYKMAQMEEGKVETAWDMVQGITAAARTIPFTDERMAVEMAATNLIPN